jgi:hypothetical protein
MLDAHFSILKAPWKSFPPTIRRSSGGTSGWSRAVQSREFAPALEHGDLQKNEKIGCHIYDDDDYMVVRMILIMFFWGIYWILSSHWNL